MLKYTLNRGVGRCASLGGHNLADYINFVDELNILQYSSHLHRMWGSNVYTVQYFICPIAKFLLLQKSFQLAMMNVLRYTNYIVVITVWVLGDTIIMF